VVADSHYFNKEQDRDKNPHQNDKSDQYPHQVEKSDPDSDRHQSEERDPEPHQAKRGIQIRIKLIRIRNTA